MKLTNSFKLGNKEVRMSRISLDAKHGAGCWVVRILDGGLKRWEKSFTEQQKAEQQFKQGVQFVKRLEGETQLASQKEREIG